MSKSEGILIPLQLEPSHLCCTCSPRSLDEVVVWYWSVLPSASFLAANSAIRNRLGILLWVSRLQTSQTDTSFRQPHAWSWPRICECHICDPQIPFLNLPASFCSFLSMGCLKWNQTSQGLLKVVQEGSVRQSLWNKKTIRSYRSFGSANERLISAMTIHAHPV